MQWLIKCLYCPYLRIFHSTEPDFKINENQNELYLARLNLLLLSHVALSCNMSGSSLMVSACTVSPSLLLSLLHSLARVRCLLCLTGAVCVLIDHLLQLLLFYLLYLRSRILVCSGLYRRSEIQFTHGGLNISLIRISRQFSVTIQMKVFCLYVSLPLKRRTTIATSARLNNFIVTLE